MVKYMVYVFIIYFITSITKESKKSMNYKKKFLVTILVSAVFCLTANADMIQNGSFEDSNLNPGSWFITLGTGNTQITGWTVIGSSIDYIGGLWNASDGNRSLDLNGSALGGVQQSINTVIGDTYKVTFDLAGNTDGYPYTKLMNVNAIGATTQTESFSFNISGHSFSNMGWTTETWTFVADSTTTTLQFISTVSGSIGPALDNITVQDIGSVEPVPVPGAFLLGLIGMGIAGIKTRKSSNS